MAAQMRIHCDVDERRVVHRRRVPARRFVKPGRAAPSLELRIFDASRAEGCTGLRRRVSFRRDSNRQDMLR